MTRQWPTTISSITRGEIIDFPTRISRHMLINPMCGSQRSLCNFKMSTPWSPLIRLSNHSVQLSILPVVRQALLGNSAVMQSLQTLPVALLLALELRLLPDRLTTCCTTPVEARLEQEQTRQC